MSEWKEYKLGEICSYGKERIGVFSLTRATYISTENMQPNRGGVVLASSIPDAGCVVAYKKDDVLVSNIRPYFKKIWLASHDGGCSADVLVFRNRENVDARFLYYLLSADSFFDYSMATAKGTKMPRGDKNSLMEYGVKLPPLAEQRRIAEILGALDDKIELNSAINRNLEEQARALFKNWFIDFAPFGGNMPGDWRKGTLSEIAEFEKDKVDVSELTASSYYSTENMLPNKAGVCPAANLPNVSQTTRCYPGETIISNIRPYFKKILFCTEELAGCSTDVLCFKPRKASLAIYNYCLLCQDDFFNYVLKGAKGTKMPRGDKSQMMKYGVCIPPEEVLQKFASIAAPMLRLVDKNRKENRSLVEFRDTLLPKLMNGEN